MNFILIRPELKRIQIRTDDVNSNDELMKLLSGYLEYPVEFPHLSLQLEGVLAYYELKGIIDKKPHFFFKNQTVWGPLILIPEAGTVLTMTVEDAQRLTRWA